VKQLKLKVSGLFVVLGAVALLAWPGTALAHERRTIGNGQYDVVVGWSGEPAYVGAQNQATIRITNAGTTTPVTGADKTLKLAIRQGASTQAFALKAAFGQDGFYTADILPTRAGDYQWIFTGDIGGTPINETFDSADGKFNAAITSAGIQFPVQLGDPAQAAAAVQAAQADAQGARMLALVAIVVGTVGLLVGLAAYMGSRRHPQTDAAPTSAVRPASEQA
jgi:hypothetical protein